jgi:hypothetical protein
MMMFLALPWNNFDVGRGELGGEGAGGEASYSIYLAEKQQQQQPKLTD